MRNIGLHVDGRALTYDDATREYALAGEPVTFAQVIEHDRTHQITWVNPETQRWAHVQATAAASPATTDAAVRGLVWWKVLLGLLFLPFTLVYLTWLMWQRRMFNPIGRAVLTGVAGVMVLTMLSAALSPTSARDSTTTPSRSAAVSPAAQPATEAAAAPTSSPQPAALNVSAVSVTRVIDGDTIEVTFRDERTEKVRLIGVDSPESTTKVQPFGKEATAYTSDALSGKTVYLETDAELRDTYGRLLAYVWMTEPPAEPTDADVAAGQFNAQLLAAGFARLMTVPPNVKYVDTFTGVQETARTAEAGLWAPKVVPEPAAKPATRPAAKQAPTKPATRSVTVYVTKTGEKYHTSGCSYLSRSKIPISLSDAKASGYTPCSRCDPPR